MDDGFRVDVTRSIDGARLSLVGELDAAAVPELAERVDALAGEMAEGGGSPHVVIDLSRLTFIDSGGIEVIRSVVEERSVEVMSAGHPCRGVRPVFEVTGLDHLVEGG